MRSSLDKGVDLGAAKLLELDKLHVYPCMSATSLTQKYIYKNRYRLMLIAEQAALDFLHPRYHLILQTKSWFWEKLSPALSWGAVTGPQVYGAGWRDGG